MQVFLIAFGLLGFELFSYLPELLKTDSRAVTVPYRALFLVLCSTVLFSPRLRKTIKVHKDFIPILLFWFFYYIRASYDTAFHLDDIKMSISDFWLFAFLLSFYPMLPLLCKINLSTITTAKHFVFFMAIALNILSIAHNYSALTTMNLSRFKSNEILNPITSGQIGAILTIMSFTYLYKKTTWIMFSLIALIALGVANVFLAASRGPVVQLVIMLLVFILLNIKRIGYKKLSFLLFLFTCLSIYFSDYISLYNTIMKRLEGTGLSQSGSDQARYILFTGAWDQFLSHPLLGDFIEGRIYGGYPHNIFLESLMALGVLGGIAMIYIFVSAFRNSTSIMKFSSTDWLGCILIMQMVAQLTSGSIYSSFAFWSLIAVISNIKNNIALYR